MISLTRPKGSEGASKRKNRCDLRRSAQAGAQVRKLPRNITSATSSRTVRTIGQRAFSGYDGGRGTIKQDRAVEVQPEGDGHLLLASGLT
jgi:hypothetical protein